MSEDQIQLTLFQNFRKRGAPFAVMFHIPNGGARHIAVAARMKALGVEAGVPDIFCASLAGGAFFLELKRLKGALSVAQSKLIDRMKTAGCRVYVTRGVDEALDVLERNGILRHAEIQ